MVENWAYPEVYTVEMPSGQFYVLNSELEGTVHVDGVDTEVNTNGILWADTLNPVTDGGIRQEVVNAYQMYTSDNRRETKATQELKKVVKKKK